jgi:hypothetical protein
MATDATTGQVIFGRYDVGLNNVGSYQSSGTPWITGSTLAADIKSGSAVRYQFPTVAKRIIVKVIPPAFNDPASSINDRADPVYVCFGAVNDSSGVSRLGVNSFNSQGETGHPAMPAQAAKNHIHTLLYISGSSSDGNQVGSRYGETQIYDIRTDHINIIAMAGPHSSATASYQIYAELTNIPEARMSVDYISGSGINT